MLKGKFGPYVSDGSTNATIPEATDPLSVTLEQALAMIAEREAKGGGKKKKKKKAAPSSKTKAKPAAKEKRAPKEKAATDKKPAAKKKAAAKPKARKKPEPVAGE